MLGAASLLAAQVENVGLVTLTILFVGLGAALPLVALRMASRELLLHWRSATLQTGQSTKSAMGIVLIASGMLILTHINGRVEAKLGGASPDRLTNATTRF